MTNSPIRFERKMIMKQETWELVELVMAGCPDEALKAFRKSVIGRGKPLRAREADSAIRGAVAALAGAKRESLDLWSHRQQWYMRHAMPVIYAGRLLSEPDDLVKIVTLQAERRSLPVIYLQFDDDGVSRLGGEE